MTIEEGSTLSQAAEMGYPPVTLRGICIQNQALWERTIANATPTELRDLQSQLDLIDAEREAVRSMTPQSTRQRPDDPDPTMDLTLDAVAEAQAAARRDATVEGKLDRILQALETLAKRA